MNNIQNTNICNGIFHISFFKALLLLINEGETTRVEMTHGTNRPGFDQNYTEIKPTWIYPTIKLNKFHLVSEKKMIPLYCTYPKKYIESKHQIFYHTAHFCFVFSIFSWHNYMFVMLHIYFYQIKYK